MKPIRSGIILLLLTVVSILGLARLQFETDILEVLPKNLKGIDALKAFREHFDEDQQVIALIKSLEDEIYEEDIALIAEDLRGDLTNATIEYKSPFEENPVGFAQALARVWTYAPENEVKAFTSRLQDAQALRVHLEQTKQEIRDSFDQNAVAMASYDPLGFLQHPAIINLTESDFSYQSEDSLSALLLVSTPDLTAGYKEHSEWVSLIREKIKASISKHELDLDFSLTGGPVYSAEIGSGMESDMTGTILVTAILVGTLFLLVQRNLGQLFMIGALLGFTFLLTLGFGGWIFGKLNLVSVGFAAILLGLVIDYAVVIAREGIGHDGAPSALRRLITPSILWAALTTSLVFGILSFSTFTGVRQLGGLIVIGLISGAFTMLYFTPIFLKRFPTRPSRAFLKPLFLSGKLSLTLLLIFALCSLVVFVRKGAPQVSFDISMVEPSSSEAAQTYAQIQEMFPAWSDDNLQLIATSKCVDEFHQATREISGRLKSLKEQGLIDDFQWPQYLVPNKKAFLANKQHWQGIREKEEMILSSLTEAGFSERGIALDKTILNELSGELFDNFSLEDSSADKLVGLFFDAGEDGTYYFSGRFRSLKPITAESLQALGSLQDENVVITGWPALQAILLPMVKRDFFVIFLPAAVVLLVALLVVFRSWKDACISISILLSVLALTNALVAVSDQSWNFLSGMAIPLIVGTGIDYSIHLIFALRRNQGDFHEVWNSVGKAILFCGLSTAIGFGSLLFASNEMLKSMGQICSVGVLLTSLLSVLIIPGLWKWGHHRRLHHH